MHHARTRSLTKYYGALPALREASFTARPGQILGYLGPNGSGKSPPSACWWVDGAHLGGRALAGAVESSATCPRIARRLGYVPEEPFLYTHLTRLNTSGSWAACETSTRA